MNLYGFVENRPTKYVDPDGRQSWAIIEIPDVRAKITKCGGFCGANIDDWIVDEINAQLAGWTKYKKDNPTKNNISGYIPWANGNQRYKDPDFFKFSTGTGCGTKDDGSEVGCGASVTLCGKCVRSSILGNLIYGIVARAAGFPDSQLNQASEWKRSIGMTVDKYDEEAYQAGADIFGGLPKNFVQDDFCHEFNTALNKGGTFLREEHQKDPGYNDLSTCRPCSVKSTVTGHGGNSLPRLRP